MYYLFREVDRGSDGTVIVVWNSLTLSQRIILVLIYSFVYSAWWRFLWYSNYIFIIYLVTHWMHVIQQCVCNQIHVLFQYLYLSDQACVWFLWYSHWKLYSLLSHIINTHLTPVFVCLFIRLTVYYIVCFYLSDQVDGDAGGTVTVDWDSLLPLSSPHKLYYSLQIIESMSHSAKLRRKSLVSRY